MEIKSKHILRTEVLVTLNHPRDETPDDEPVDLLDPIAVENWLIQHILPAFFEAVKAVEEETDSCTSYVNVSSGMRRLLAKAYNTELQKQRDTLDNLIDIADDDDARGDLIERRHAILDDIYEYRDIPFIIVYGGVSIEIRQACHTKIGRIFVCSEEE